MTLKDFCKASLGLALAHLSNQSDLLESPDLLSSSLLDDVFASLGDEVVHAVLLTLPDSF
jgi:hypothetical protein